MKNLIPAEASRRVAMTLLKTQKNSPAILFGAGVVGVVGTVVMASRATLKLEDVLEETNEKLETVRTLQHDKYSDEDRVKDKAVVYTRAVVDISKLYAPAFALGLVSIACLSGSHHILTRRNAALGAAYAGLDKAFREYRGRVVEEIGEEREARVYQPVDKIDVVDEDGKKTKGHVATAKGGSPYKVLFDEANKHWVRHAEYNQIFIQAQQNYANDLLHSRGFVFLNDVHDMLGLPRTKAGQIVGWVDNGDGDNYIDFGVFKNDPHAGMRFVAGDERSIWLDFNVDGPVLDILDDKA